MKRATKPKPKKERCPTCEKRSYTTTKDGTYIWCRHNPYRHTDVTSPRDYRRFCLYAETCEFYAKRKQRSEYEDMLASQLTYNGISFEREFKAVEGNQSRWDFCIEDRNLLVEVNGAIWVRGGHSTGAGITRDYEKLHMAQEAGWYEFMVSSQHVIDGTALTWIISFKGGEDE